MPEPPITPTAGRKRPMLADVVNEEEMQEKRRRLLTRADWTGLEMQQPIDVIFPDQTQNSGRALWGKRDDSRQRGIPKRKSEVSPERPTSTIIQADRSLNVGTHVYPLRIQIGSQTVTNASSSSTQAMREEPRLPIRRAHIDSMLPPARKLRSNQDIFHQSPGSSGLGSQDFLGIAATNRRYRHRSSPQQRGLEEIQRRDCKHDGPEHAAYASSEVYGPIPQRAEISAILHASPSILSTDSESIHAEVGRPKRRALSEVADNERWLCHLVPSDDMIIPLTRGSSLLDSPRFRPTVSPGISELPSQADISTTEIPKATSLSYTSSTSEKLLDNEKEELIHVVELPPVDDLHKKHLNKPQASISNVDSIATDDDHSNNLNGRDLLPHALVHRRQSHNNSVTYSSTKFQDRAGKDGSFSVPVDDDNAAWMGFLFGEENDNFKSNTFLQAARDAAKELKPSESSGYSERIISGCPRTQKHNDTDLNVDSPTTEQTSYGLGSSDCPSASHTSIRGSDSSPELHSIRTPQSHDTTDVIVTDSLDLVTSNLSAANTSSLDGILSGTESNQATAGSSVVAETVQSTFRFAAPQTFVGKLAALGARSGEVAPPRHPVVHSRDNQGRVRTRRGPRRRKKRNPDGRADIRALPDFDDDPIEESDG